MTRSPRKGWVLTQESFDELLAWLNADREQAARKYEAVRSRLIRIFIHRGCVTAEDLADNVMNQVARKVHEVREYYIGDPALYFYGVARNIFSEYCKTRPDTVALVPETLSAPPVEMFEPSEPEQDCLDKCLDKLTPHNRELLLEYYRESEGGKIEHHKEMARRLGVAVNALRIRMCRLRATVKECMRECLSAEGA